MLVIIGLIIGGILVGRDLISASEIRGQISQIEKYNTAANTFRIKTGFLPGDIPEPHATGLGLVARGVYLGEGDGNGIIQGHFQTNLNTNCGSFYLSGESVLFFTDLSASQLIDVSLNTATANDLTPLTSDDIPKYLPAAKINGNYLAVGSGRCDASASSVPPYPSINYFAITATIDANDGNRHPQANLGLTVNQAYNIDAKIDDGLPQSGRVTAQYWNCTPWGSCAQRIYWAGTSNATLPPYTTATPASSTTCFDNGNVAGTQKYSTGTNGGNGKNCSLLLRFQ